MITVILAQVLTTILTAIGWQKLILRVLVSLIRYVDKKISNPDIKKAIEGVADDLDNAINGQKQVAPPSQP